MSAILLGVAIAFAVVWVIVTWLSGLGVNVWHRLWDFEATGQLGDSFGVVTAVMTSLAAIFTFRALEIARRERVENSYLNLLERRFQISDHVGTTVPWTASGMSAIEALAKEARDRAEDLGPKLAFEAGVLDKSRGGLGTFFRFNYHIVKFAHDHFRNNDRPSISKSDEAYQMIRLMRAQLTDDEVLLIALNCVYGGGVEKFKPLAERYALLHNMRREDIELFDLRNSFGPGAFGVTRQDQVNAGL